ncbi:helix-turn-helix domain-containing protein [Streptomyces sp. CA-294286]|uniref:helix-turn-helix domain-containing protein n=1 Tax=Streptomyces sp. CA-294286 TaxID=3240070 RepID=UPI003D944672
MTHILRSVAASAPAAPTTTPAAPSSSARSTASAAPVSSAAPIAPTAPTAPAAPAPGPPDPLPPPEERRRLREAKALSQAQVATILGVTRETVRAWESGRATPRGHKGEAYAGLLAGIEEELRTEGPAAPGRSGTPPNAPDALTSAVPQTSDAAAVDTAPRTNPTAAPARTDRPAKPARARTDRTTAPARTDRPAKPARTDRPAKPARARTDRTTAPARTDRPAKPARTDRPAKPARARTDRTTTPTRTDRPAKPARTDRPAKPARARTDRSATRDRGKSPVAPEHADGLTRSGRRTPAQAFDELYARTAPSLVRQAYLLTGRNRLAQETVERAFQLAWQRWPAVATDRDPAGWVRAAAYEYAMSPWHRLRPGHRRVDEPARVPESAAATGAKTDPVPSPESPAGPPAAGSGAASADGAGPAADPRALLHALLELPPPYRRTLVLYDGLGLDLPETAAETEATTPAAASRLEYARCVVARRLPEVAEARTPAEQSAVLQERLGALALAQPADGLPPGEAVRTGGERRIRFWTRAAIAFTTLIIGATAFTLATAPTRYESPRPPGEPVGGVPAHSGPQRLSSYDKQLRAKLRAEPEAGPERLLPQPR